MPADGITLTFVQRTRSGDDGTDTVSTWYESLRHVDSPGTQLHRHRAPGRRQQDLFTADSAWVMRGGKLFATRDHGNEFLPLIEGVHISRTTSELRGAEVDMSQVTSGKWQGRPVWIVGARSVADSTSPQFWVDVERNVVVRMILSPQNTAPMMNVHLDNYVPLSGGWLATKIVMTVDGAPRQSEEYSHWQTGVALSDSPFQPSTWTSAHHWASP
jgi:hypothetical protein